MLSSPYTMMRRPTYFRPTCLYWLPKPVANGKDTFLININSKNLFIVVHIVSGSGNSDRYNAGAIAHNEWLAIETHAMSMIKQNILNSTKGVVLKTTWNLWNQVWNLISVPFQTTLEKNAYNTFFETIFETGQFCLLWIWLFKRHWHPIINFYEFVVRADTIHSLESPALNWACPGRCKLWQLSSDSKVCISYNWQDTFQARIYHIRSMYLEFWQIPKWISRCTNANVYISHGNVTAHDACQFCMSPILTPIHSQMQ
jgi:hypothetical protein